MIFDYDPAKHEANRVKHDVPLMFGVRVFDDVNHVVLASFRPVDGEDRFKAVGMVDGRLWTAVYVERGEAVGLISMRRSNAGEQRNHDRHSG